MSEALATVVDHDSAVNELQKLRKELAPFDLDTTEIPEVLEINKIHFPENQTDTQSAKNIHSMHTLDMLIKD